MPCFKWKIDDLNKTELHICLPDFLWFLYELAGFHLPIPGFPWDHSSVSINKLLFLMIKYLVSKNLNADLESSTEGGRSLPNEDKTIAQAWSGLLILSESNLHICTDRFPSLLPRQQCSAVCSITYICVLLLISPTSATRQLCKLTNYAVH